MAATMKDIARKTGLGLATISKYLNGGRVLDKNRLAIEQAIHELDFTVNEFARSLKTGRSGTVGVVIPELSNLFSTTIIATMEDRLRQSGVGVLVCDCRTDARLERQAVRFLLGKRVDGLINMPVDLTGEALAPAFDKQLPVILLDRLLEDCPADAVVVDNERAAREACGHLIAHGHREIGLIAGPPEVYTSRRRLSGYRAAFTTAGLELPDPLLTGYGDYSMHSGYECTKALLARCSQLSALMVTNYEMTLGCLMALGELHLSWPEQLSLIGFDNMQLSQLIQPRLTLVEQPLQEMGRQVAGLMLERLASGIGPPRRIELATRLSLGGSVGAPRKQEGRS